MYGRGEKTRMPFMQRTVLAVIFSFVMSEAGQSAAIQADCVQSLQNGSEKIRCQIRSNSGRPLADLTANLADGTRVAAKLRRYSWATETTTYYYVVETAGINGAQIERMGAFLQRAASPVGKRKIGIAIAGATYREAAPLGSYRFTLDRFARDLKKGAPEKGQSVVLLSLKTAIETASKEKAARKAVIVLSSPSPPSQGVDQDDIIRAAKNGGVRVYVVAFGENRNAPSSFLARIGNETGGAAFDTSNLTRSELLDLSSRVLDLNESGFSAEIDPEGLPSAFQLSFSGGVDGEETVKSSPLPLERLSEDPWHYAATRFLSDNLATILASLGLGAGLILVLSSQPLLRRAIVGTPLNSLLDLFVQYRPLDRNRRAGCDTGMVSKTSQDGIEKQAAAWLEILGSGMPPVPLAAGRLNIGRSSENDIRLSGRTVHRRHAILEMESDSAASIQDLATKNGVFVNGKRINELALADGDIIELGDVKLRFVKEKCRRTE